LTHDHDRGRWAAALSGQRPVPGPAGADLVGPAVRDDGHAVGPVPAGIDYFPFEK
jgi:hypothetical protein